MMMNRVIIVRI